MALEGDLLEYAADAEICGGTRRVYVGGVEFPKTALALAGLTWSRESRFLSLYLSRDEAERADLIKILLPGRKRNFSTAGMGLGRAARKESVEESLLIVP